MADGTHIEWTDATWNPITGCSIESPGCKHCYAMKLAGTRLQHHPSRAGLTVDTKAGPVWNGEVRFNEQWLTEPLRWKRPRRIFVVAHGDLFHESVPDSWIDRVFAVMALAPQHQFQVLTKRALRMREYLAPAEFDPLNSRLSRIQDAAYRMMATIDGRWNEARAMAAREAVIAALDPGEFRGFANVWLGVSAENQHWLMQRATHLVETPAALRFLSYEPALDALDLEPFLLPVRQWSNGWANNYPYQYPKHRLDWVICGGESGDGARPMRPDWARSVRDQCAAAGVPFLFKQWGSYAPLSTAPEGTMFRGTKKITGRLLDGVEHNGFPA
jgi:protein gp37